MKKGVETDLQERNSYQAREKNREEREKELSSIQRERESDNKRKIQKNKKLYILYYIYIDTHLYL